MTNPTIQRRPFSVNIIAPAYPAFQQASALCQMGYHFAPELPVEITSTGQAIFTMILGQPSQEAVNAAFESINHGNHLEAMAYERDVQARAEALLADYKRAEAEKQVAALKAQQARELAAMQKAQAAELAKL